MPKISVIVPVYNVEKYLRECLDSIVNQTLKDIEIICIDDCSTDNSLQILKEYASKDNRIRIIEQKINQGQGVARNNGIKLAQGECIGFVDPDDWIEPDMYEKMYNCLNEENCDIVMCDLKEYHDDSNKFKIVNRIDILKKYRDFDFLPNKVYSYEDIKPIIFRSLPNYMGLRLYKTEFIKNNNILCASYRKSEDNLFSIKAKILGKFYYLNEPFYNYRRHRGSTVLNVIAPVHQLNEDIKNLLIELNKWDDLKDYYDEYVAQNYFSNYNLLNKNLKKEFKKLNYFSLTKKQKAFVRKFIFEVFISKVRRFPSFIFSIKNKYLNHKKIKYIKFLGLEFILFNKKSKENC